MPYLKKKDEPFAPLRRLLIGYGLTARVLGPIIGKNENTARERLKHIDKMTLGELRRIVRSGHIPADEIREAIQF